MPNASAKNCFLRNDKLFDKSCKIWAGGTITVNGTNGSFGDRGGAQTPYPSLKGTFPFKKWIDKSKSTLQRRVGWSVWSPPRPPKRDVGPVTVIVPGRREKFRIWIWDKNSEFSHYSIIRIFFTFLQNEASPLLSLLVTFISYVCNRMLRSFKLGIETKNLRITILVYLKNVKSMWQIVMVIFLRKPQEPRATNNLAFSNDFIKVDIWYIGTEASN